ncbi:MAG: hypothetical protein PUD20_02510 [bacterium]|nr:hypothetical protein [bacterium]
MAKDGLGITNMNGDTTDENKTCGLQDMNCLAGQEVKEHSLNNMNGDSGDDDKSCGLQDMNCVQ